jgi:hypothetical protein
VVSNQPKVVRSSAKPIQTRIKERLAGKGMVGKLLQVGIAATRVMNLRICLLALLGALLAKGCVSRSVTVKHNQQVPGLVGRRVAGP